MNSTAHPIRNVTLKYALMNTFYWTSVCGTSCFLSAFMLPKGFSNSVIGLTIALSNILAMFLQPLIASLVDRFRQISLKLVISAFSAAAAVFCAILLIYTTGNTFLVAILVMSIVFISTLQPFTNAVSVELEDNGYSVNFGFCRSFGSLGYAVASTIMGFLIDRWSVAVIPTASILFCLLLMISALVIGRPDKRPAHTQKELLQTAGGHSVEIEPASKTIAATGSSSLFAFMFSNKRFLLFLLSVVLLFTSHSITTNFLYQIIVAAGGGNSSFGIAGSIGAVLELPAMIFFTRLMKKFRCRTLLRVAAVGFMVRFLAFFLANSVVTVYLAEFPQIFAYALFIPASVYYAGHLFNKADMAKAQSLVTAAITLGAILSNLIGGKLIDLFGVHTTLLAGLLIGITGALILIFSAENVD